MAMLPNDAIPDISEIKKHFNLSEKQVAVLQKMQAIAATAKQAEDAMIGQLIRDARAIIRVHVDNTGRAPTAYKLKVASVDDDGTKKHVFVVSDTETFKDDVD